MNYQTMTQLLQAAEMHHKVSQNQYYIVSETHKWVSDSINSGFTVFSHGIKHVVFTFGLVDESIQTKPLGVLSHGTTYLACSSYCWSVDKIILV